MALLTLLLACLATLSPLSSASPLWVVTAPRYISWWYNVSILDPVTGALSHTTQIVNNRRNETRGDDYQIGTNAVFAAATSSLVMTDWTYNYTSRVGGRQWVAWHTQTETLSQVGELESLKLYEDLCQVRDEAAGITWRLSFNTSTPSNSTGPGIGNGTIGAFLWQYSDTQTDKPPTSALFSVVLPFDPYHPAFADGCAFNQQKRLLYVQMNGRPSILHTISIAQQKVVTSIAYPQLRSDGHRYDCNAIAYSDKQQQLYSFLTEDNGMTPHAVQAVDPFTGNNRTLINGSSIAVTWWNHDAWDDETGSWFLTDLQTGVYQMLKLSPTSGSSVATGRPNDSAGSAADSFMVWKAAYAYAPQAAAKSPVTASPRSPVWSRMVELVEAMKRRE